MDVVRLLFVEVLYFSFRFIVMGWHRAEHVWGVIMFLQSSEAFEGIGGLGLRWLDRIETAQCTFTFEK